MMSEKCPFFMLFLESEKVIQQKHFCNSISSSDNLLRTLEINIYAFFS